MKLSLNPIPIQCFILFLLAAMTQPAFAVNMSALRKCPDVPSCLALLDKDMLVASKKADVSDVRAIAAELLRFGEAMKQELVARVLVNDLEWSGYAISLLRQGKWEWKPGDVAPLRESLRRKSGTSAAYILGIIGTDDAINALIEDLICDRCAGYESQTGHSLTLIGDKSLPLLLPVLSGDDRNKWWQALHVVRNSKSRKVKPEWIALALDTKKPASERIGALRGLSVMKLSPAEIEKLSGLYGEADPAVLQQAKETLTDLGSPKMLDEIAARCKDGGFNCVLEIGKIGVTAPDRAGPVLVKFLDLPPEESSPFSAITALALIGYRPAIPAIEKKLASPDIAISYSAVRSLLWLDARSSVGKLRESANHYWLPELKAYAQDVANRLASGKNPEHPPTGVFDEQHVFDNVLASYSPDFFGTQPACPSNKWVWDGKPFIFSGPDFANEISVELEDGTLKGEDSGEWGGSLSWHQKGLFRFFGSTVQGGNVTGIVKSSKGAVVSFGLAHLSINYGYVGKYERDSRGNYTFSKIGNLLGRPSQLTAIGYDVFAVWSGGRPIVFDSDAIRGVAECEK